MPKPRKLPKLPSHTFASALKDYGHYLINKVFNDNGECFLHEIEEEAKLNKMYSDKKGICSEYGPDARYDRATAFMNGWFQLEWLRDEDYEDFWIANRKILCQNLYSPKLATKLKPFGRLAPHKLRQLKPAAEAHSSDIKAEAEFIVKNTVKEMLRIVRRKANDLPIPKGWKPKITLDWNINRKRSYGGISYIKKAYVGGGINLAMYQRTPLAYSQTKASYYFHEYSHIINDPTIGAFTCNSWRVTLKALVAHELAHAIQYKLPAIGRHRNIDYRTPHGEGWQRIYALLRHECVNPHINKA